MVTGSSVPTAKNLFALKALVIFLGIVFVTLVIVFFVLLASDIGSDDEKLRHAAPSHHAPAVLPLAPGERVSNVYSQAEMLILQIDGPNATRIVTMHLSGGDFVTRAVLTAPDSAP